MAGYSWVAGNDASIDNLSGFAGAVVALGDDPATAITFARAVRQAAGLEKGSTTPGKGGFAGSITDAQVTEIAQTKLPDLNTDDLDAAKAQIAGTARSMGINVES